MPAGCPFANSAGDFGYTRLMVPGLYLHMSTFAIVGLTKLSTKDIIIILAPALFFDFFWQYLVRLAFIVPTRTSRYLRTRRFKKRVAIFKFALSEAEQKLKTFRRDLADADRSSTSERSRIQSLIVSEVGRRDHLKDTLNRLLEPEFIPRISIIVPCHNSEAVLAETLNSLVELSYPNKEIIVVDDASTDRTYKTAESFLPRVKLYRREISTGRKTGAVNFGLTFATGEVVAVVDDDTIVGRNSLQPLVQPMGNPVIGAAGANIRVKTTKRTLVGTMQRIEYLTTMELGRQFQSFVYHAVFVISGAFGAFTRSYLEQIGHYDVDIITEDLDITWKLYKLRKLVVYVPQATAWTDVPTTYRQLAKQRTRWDRGLFETLTKHRRFLFNPRYGTIGLLLLPEAFFEVLMLMVRPFYYLLILALGYPFMSVLILASLFYLILEFLLIATSTLISEEKSSIWLTTLALPMLLYRQFLAAIRWRALLLFLCGRRPKW